MTRLILVIIGCFMLFGCTTVSHQIANHTVHSYMDSVDMTAFIDKVHVALENPLIREQLLAANEVHQSMSEAEFKTLDAQIQQNKSEVHKLQTNLSAVSLLQIQVDFPGISELFVTDAFGMNIAQTNTTTDYFQADEDWWQKTYNQGKGLVWIDKIAFDASAQVESISIYMPIIQINKVIGVAKVVIHTIAIEQLFWPKVTL